MVKTRSKNRVKDKTIGKLLAEEKKPVRVRHEKKGLKVRFLETKGKIKELLRKRRKGNFLRQ